MLRPEEVLIDKREDELFPLNSVLVMKFYQPSLKSIKIFIFFQKGVKKQKQKQSSTERSLAT